MDKTLRVGADFIARQQAKDGSFLGHASRRPHDFRDYREHQTIFFTALISTCLQGVPYTKKLRAQAINFLISQQSDAGSWNYWRRDSYENDERPYPDDLDDTFCALAALAAYDPKLIDGTVLGKVANLLVANEDKPGGPYQTWLTDWRESPAWNDVDLAVNANIGYFLSLQNVRVPNLEQFVADALTTGKFESRYYCGPIPSWYFLSRWYGGTALGQLKEYVRTALTARTYTNNPLMLALLVTTACNLDLAAVVIKPAAQRLRELQVDDHWAAEALYDEPPVAGTAYYAGSEALTTAFVLEALVHYRQLAAKTSPIVEAAKPNGTATRRLAASLPSPMLRHQYRSWLRQLTRNGDGRQITMMSTITAAACQRTAPSACIANLNLGSLHGWLAYTIYDDFLDDEGHPELLSLANVALRASLTFFDEALPGHQEFQTLVRTSFNQIDAANTWEVRWGRAVVRPSGVYIRRLPDYDDYGQLADRSWGHSLAACGTLVALGHAINSPEMVSLQRFFRHFLIARQLNDDAHDWEADLRRGQLSAVVTLLLQTFPDRRGWIMSESMIEKLQVYFWQHTIETVARLIVRHVRLARRALAACSAIKDPKEYESWLTKLETSAKQAVIKRDEARKFMTAYKHEMALS